MPVFINKYHQLSYDIIWNIFVLFTFAYAKVVVWFNNIKVLRPRSAVSKR